jgi:hypothetical protein
LVDNKQADGLRLGLLTGIAAYMRKYPSVPVTELAVYEQTRYGIVTREYVWDFGSYLPYHSPAKPNIIIPVHGTQVLRLRTRDDAPDTFYQVHYLPDATNSYLQGFMEGIAKFPIDQSDVFYYE